jgi:hypothetical protein
VLLPVLGVVVAEHPARLAGVAAADGG